MLPVKAVLTEHAPHLDAVVLVDADTAVVVDVLDDLTEDKVEGQRVLQPLSRHEHLHDTEICIYNIPSTSFQLSH